MIKVRISVDIMKDADVLYERATTQVFVEPQYFGAVEWADVLTMLLLDAAQRYNTQEDKDEGRIYPFLGRRRVPIQ